MIYTFYSYKGGVGRSMALANVAEWLYLRGLRVIIIDWDLEAPGLENFFYRSREELDLVRSQLGLIDMLSAYKRLFPRLSFPEEGKKQEAGLGDGDGGGRQRILETLREHLPPLSDSLYPIHAPTTTDGDRAPALWLLPAGLRAGERFPLYAQAVQGFDWADFYASYRGEAYFEWMRTQLVDEDLADIVLIDSRTGVTEMGGVCTRQLADVVVSFCVPNVQNLAGVEMMAGSFTREELLRTRQRELAVVVVPTRIDVSELDARNHFEKEFRQRLDPFTPPVFRAVKSAFWDLLIQYIPKYAYAEKLAVNAPDSARELEDAYKKLAAHLVLLAHGSSGMRVRKCYAQELRNAFGQLLPSVAIAYVGGEGEHLARETSARLMEYGVALSPDIVDLTNGGNEWRQFKASPEQSKFLLLVVTPEAQQSILFRQEWRYARQQGICVHLVTRSGRRDDPEDAAAPLWLRKEQSYDLDHDWELLVRHLQSPCPAVRAPFMAPDLPEYYVERRELLDQLKDAALTANQIGLWGPPGTGKKGLAIALCHDEDILAHFDDGVLWVTLGTEPNLLGALAAMYTALTGEQASFTNQAEATARLAEQLSGRRCLVVIEDVWDAKHLQPFLSAGRQCTFLVTTRDFNIAAATGAKLISVGETTDAEARRILTAQLSLAPAELALIDDLMRSLGKWPLVLKLANIELRKRVTQGAAVADALTSLRQALDRQGVLALEQATTPDLQQGIAQAIAPSLAQLSEEERGRYFQLAFFAAETDIPLRAVGERWGMNEVEAEQHLRRFADLSLLAYDPSGKTTRLYSALHSYCKQQSATPVDPNALLEATFARFSPEEQSEARRALTRLVRISAPEEGGEDSLVNVKLTEFGPAAQKLIHALAEDRVVVLESDGAAGATVRIANEAFLKGWKRFRQWLDEDRPFLLWRQQLRANMTDWVNTFRDRGALLIGAPLTVALDWREKRGEDLNEAELSYITTSLHVEQKSKRRVAIVGVATALLLLGAIFYATWRKEQATQEEAQAQQTARTAEEKQKAAQATAYVIEANEAARKGAANAALDLYQSALALNPGFAEAHLQRGIVYDQMEEFDRAVSDYTKAIELKPDYADAYFNRGISFAHKGDYERAIADYAQAIQLNPANPVAYVNRGLALENKGRKELAIADYGKAIELKPDYADAYFNRGVANQSRGEREKAIADFQHLVKQNPDSQTMQAAQARLQQLGALAAPQPAKLPSKIYLHYGDRGDKAVLDNVARALADKGFQVQGTELVSGRTDGDVRYFYREDERRALDVKRATEASLAQEGVKTNLNLIYVDAAKFPKVQRGSIEIWLPPLSRRLPSRSLENKALY